MYKRLISKLNFFIFMSCILMSCQVGGADTDFQETQGTIVALQGTNTARDLELLESTVEAIQSVTLSPSMDVDEDLIKQATKTAIELESLYATVEAIQSSQVLQTPIVPNTESPGETPTSISPGDIIIPEATSTPQIEYLFFEDFSNNDNGWDLSPNPDGSVRITQTGLTLSAENQQRCLIVKIPNLTVDGSYFIEMDVLVESEGFGSYGFAFGTLPTQWNSYGIGDTAGKGDIIWANDGSSSVTEANRNFWERGTYFTLGMEVKNGLYTLYYNGELLESTQFIPSGIEIGVYSCKWHFKVNQVSIDKIRISETR